MPGRPPPGRAGRLWLTERLGVAGRAAELLERKHQLLRNEQRRLAEVAARSGDEWHALAAAADIWNVRSRVAGDGDELRRATLATGAAQVNVAWVSQAGVTYPGSTTVDLPDRPSLAASPALREAADACRAALVAAVSHAAATAALAQLDAELLATTRRTRAIRDRWLPQLDTALRELDLRLDDEERDETTRQHWSGPQGSPTRKAGP